MWDYKKKKGRKMDKRGSKERFRYNIIIAIIYIMGVILMLQLFNLQVVQGREYRETSNTRLTREAVIKAARGNIEDCNNNKLVTNKMGIKIELYKTKIDNQTLNKLILNLVKLLENNGDKGVDNLPLEIKPYRFKIENEDKMKKWKKEYIGNENANPEETFNILKKKYEINEENVENVRKIMAIRYEINKNGYGSIKPVILAKNISVISANQIEEQKERFPGISIVVEPIVEYPYGKLASHVLGYIGAINQEEYMANKDKYTINDDIGRTGIQYTLEEYLKGQDGIRQIDMNVAGNITGEYIAKEAVAGNNVTLTIDANLQSIVEQALVKSIEEMSKKDEENKEKAKAGTAIVMDVETGDIKALASYPDYEPELFITGITNEKIEEYNRNSSLYNRAISGRYAPGSTFKMVSAIAGLQEGIITPETKINDIGVYPKGHHPTCWYYAKHHYGHGYLNVSQAIQKSCNYFFYEIGEKLGIDKIYEYARRYGLDKKTGIELSGESKGIIASKEYKKKIYNEEWQLGETLSAVIGQSYNSFTPIEMARYVSMLANGGKQIEVSLIKNIKDSSNNIISKDEVRDRVNKKLGIEGTLTQVEDINIKPENIEAVLKGMKGVTSEPGGTAYYIFKDLGIDIGGKTGSAETGKEDEINGWFVGFAPFDKPKIAVVVLIENAGSGGNVAPVAKEIITKYLGLNAKDINEDTEAIPNVEINR